MGDEVSLWVVEPVLHDNFETPGEFVREVEWSSGALDEVFRRLKDPCKNESARAAGGGRAFVFGGFIDAGLGDHSAEFGDGLERPGE